MKEKYKLTGVGCMKCVAKIEKNLSEMKGVENVKVDVETKYMDISYDEKTVPFSEIEKKLIEIGYGIDKNSEESEEKKKEVVCEFQQEEIQKKNEVLSKKTVKNNLNFQE